MQSLDTYLKDIEIRLIPEQEEQLLADWRTFARGEGKEPFFSPVRAKKPAPAIDWPEININDAIEEDELMVISQFARVSQQLEHGFGGLLTVRSNYGVGIVPSLFGAEPFIMPREMDTLPNVKPLAGGEPTLSAIAESPVPDFTEGHGPAVFRVGTIYEEIYSRYPRIAEYIRTDHPDCQGPMDILELLWGSDMFLALYDRSDLVHALLEKITQVYIAFLDTWFGLSPRKDELHSYFGNAHLGSICVRDDSAMNLSPEMYAEFIMPYNDRVLTHFGGGAIHSCGKVDHFTPHLTKMKDLHAFNMSQPEYNDMETVYQNTVDKRLPVIGLRYETVRESVHRGRDLKGLVSTNAA
jgi:hypothetical protein